MDNTQKNYDELINLIDEASRVLDKKLKSGEITQYEYDELKTLDFEHNEERDPIVSFKESYAERKPIRCSRLLFDIYDIHKSSFRKRRNCLVAL